MPEREKESQPTLGFRSFIRRHVYALKEAVGIAIISSGSTLIAVGSRDGDLKPVIIGAFINTLGIATIIHIGRAADTLADINQRLHRFEGSGDSNQDRNHDVH